MNIGLKTRSVGVLAAGAMLGSVLSFTPLAATTGGDAAAPTCNGLPATVVGTDGDDVLQGTFMADVIVGLGGDDVINGASGEDTICGGDGDDTINGQSQADTIFGEAGNDTITGADGADVIDGGPGNDNIRGDSQDDTLIGGDGDDTITGSSGADTIDGGDGVDTITGDSQNDVIHGGNGDDDINGGSGDDALDGGNGVDVVDGLWNTDTCDDAETAINCETETNNGEDDQEPATDTDGDGTPDSEDPDIDNDGTPNEDDAFPLDANEDTDTDADGVGNNTDEDDDNDGIADGDDPNPLEPADGADTDGDGVPDDSDSDIDGDGVPNDEDEFPTNSQEVVDTDGDGIGDFADPDSDNDGVPDVEDSFRTDPTRSDPIELPQEALVDSSTARTTVIQRHPGLPDVSLEIQTAGNFNQWSVRIDEVRAPTDELLEQLAGPIVDLRTVDDAPDFETAQLTLSYDSEVLGNIPEADLVIWTFNHASEVWEVVPGQQIVDTDANQITVQLEHFSYYTILRRVADDGPIGGLGDLPENSGLRTSWLQIDRLDLPASVLFQPETYGAVEPVLGARLRAESDNGLTVRAAQFQDSPVTFDDDRQCVDNCSEVRGLAQIWSDEDGGIFGCDPIPILGDDDRCNERKIIEAAINAQQIFEIRDQPNLSAAFVFEQITLSCAIEVGILASCADAIRNAPLAVAEGFAPEDLAPNVTALTNNNARILLTPEILDAFAFPNAFGVNTLNGSTAASYATYGEALATIFNSRGAFAAVFGPSWISDADGALELADDPRTPPVIADALRSIRDDTATSIRFRNGAQFAGGFGTAVSIDRLRDELVRIERFRQGDVDPVELIESYPQVADGGEGYPVDAMTGAEPQLYAAFDAAVVDIPSANLSQIADLVGHLPETNALYRNALFNAMYLEYNDALRSFVQTEASNHWAAAAFWASRSIRGSYELALEFEGLPVEAGIRQAIADGNHAIFLDVGTRYSQLFELLNNNPNPSNEQWENWFRNTFSEDELDLQLGFAALVAASFTDSPQRKQELIFQSNILSLVQEQAGADVYIDAIDRFGPLSTELAPDIRFSNTILASITEDVGSQFGINLRDPELSSAAAIARFRLGSNYIVDRDPLFFEFNSLDQFAVEPEFAFSYSATDSDAILLEQLSPLGAESRRWRDWNLSSTLGIDDPYLESQAVQWNDYEDRMWFLLHLFRVLHTAPSVTVDLPADEWGLGESGEGDHADVRELLGDTAISRLQIDYDPSQRDRDGDGVPDLEDNCPSHANPSQAPTVSCADQAESTVNTPDSLISGSTLQPLQAIGDTLVAVRVVEDTGSIWFTATKADGSSYFARSNGGSTEIVLTSADPIFAVGDPSLTDWDISLDDRILLFKDRLNRFQSLIWLLDTETGETIDATGRGTQNFRPDDQLEFHRGNLFSRETGSSQTAVWVETEPLRITSPVIVTDLWVNNEYGLFDREDVTVFTSNINIDNNVLGGGGASSSLGFSAVGSRIRDVTDDGRFVTSTLSRTGPDGLYSTLAVFDRDDDGDGVLDNSVEDPLAPGSPIETSPTLEEGLATGSIPVFDLQELLPTDVRGRLNYVSSDVSVERNEVAVLFSPASLQDNRAFVARFDLDTNSVTSFQLVSNQSGAEQLHFLGSQVALFTQEQLSLNDNDLGFDVYVLPTSG